MVWEVKLFERPRHGGKNNIRADLKMNGVWGCGLDASCWGKGHTRVLLLWTRNVSSLSNMVCIISQVAEWLFTFQRWNLFHADLSVMSRQRRQSVVVSWQSSTFGTEVVLDCWIFWRYPDFCLNVSVAYMFHTFTAIVTFIHFWCHYCNWIVINILKISWKQSRKYVRW